MIKVRFSGGARGGLEGATAPLSEGYSSPVEGNLENDALKLHFQPV